MKNRTQVFRLSHIFILSLILHGFSCGNKDDSAIDIDYILETDSSIRNAQALNSIQSNLQMYESENYTITNGRERKVKLSDAIAILFDPEKQSCPIPGKVARKLRKLRDDQKAWAPKFVKEQLASMPDSALYLPGTSLSTLLHSVEIRKADGGNYKWTVVGSPTFKNMNIDDYVLTSGYNSFVYTLDCSGYLTAAIAASGVVPGADINANAESSIEKQNSLFVGGGVLISPLYGAVYAEQVGINIDTLDRIRILKALINIPGISENDTIDTSLSFEVIWASKEGSSSFNGRATLAARSQLGIGVAQVSATGESGGAVSRKSSFSSFETYVTKTERLPAPEKIIVKNVKTLIERLTEPISQTLAIK